MPLRWEWRGLLFAQEAPELVDESLCHLLPSDFDLVQVARCPMTRRYFFPHRFDFRAVWHRHRATWMEPTSAWYCCRSSYIPVKQNLLSFNVRVVGQSGRKQRFGVRVKWV
jgi:hypothetical protein